MGPSSPSHPIAAGPLPTSLLKKLEPSNFWNEQVEALEQLNDITIPLSKQANEDAIMRQLRPYGYNLAEVIQSPRSALVKSVCMCIETFAETFGPNFVAAVGIEVIPALLKRCSTTKAVIRGSAREAAKAMFEHGVEGVHLSTARLISQTVVDKQSPVLTRAAAAEFIGLMLVERCRDGLSDIQELIHNAIVEGCGDPDGNVREISRENCSRLLNVDPVLWERVFRDLPAQSKQYIARPLDRIGAADESVLRRRASMLPQRARPRPESMHTGMPVGLRSRYAPARAQRASVNPVDMNSQQFLKNNIPPRLPNLPRPSRVDLDFRANLPRKSLRSVSRAPRRSIAPFIPQNDINISTIQDQTVATSPFIQSTPIAQTVLQDNVPSQPKGLMVGEKVSPKEKTPPKNVIPDSLQVQSTASKESIEGEDIEDAAQHSVCLTSPTLSDTQNLSGESEQAAGQGEQRDSPMGSCLSAISNKFSGTESEATATPVEAKRSPIPSLTIRSPSETKPVCSSSSPSQGVPADNEDAGGNENSTSSRESTPFREEDGEVSSRLTESPVLKKHVNKGRLSFIMGVNKTPRVIRTEMMGRPDMNVVKFLQSPMPAANEDAAKQTEEKKFETALAFDEDDDKRSDCAALTIANVENGPVAIEEEECAQTKCVVETMESSTNETKVSNTTASMVSQQANDRETTSSQKMADSCEGGEDDGAERETKNSIPLGGSSTAGSSDNDVSGNEEPTTGQSSHGSADSTEQLLKTPQMSMPDIADFAKLMEDIEKQTLCNVAPEMAFTQKADVMNRSGSVNSGSDKENVDDGSAQKERRVQVKLGAIRKDAADMKPPQKSRAASFKGRPPRRSLMPQTGTTGGGATVGTTAVSKKVESGASEDGEGKKGVSGLKKSDGKADELDNTRKAMVRMRGDTKTGRGVGTGTGTGKGAEKAGNGSVGKTVRSGWTNGIGTTRASVLRARENMGNIRAQQVGRANGAKGEGKGVVKVEKRKKSVLPVKVQEVVDALRACNAAKKQGWQAKSEALKRFEMALRGAAEEKMAGRLAEDCVYMLGEYIVDGHHRVVVGALEGFFYLFLCSEGGAQARALQRALERRIETVRRILQLTQDRREDTRLASERVLDGFGVQFEAEAQVAVVVQAMTSEKGRSRMMDGRVATSGCALLVQAFERAERNEGGFVWKVGLLEVIVSVIGRLCKDRRLEVRKAARAVVTAVKQCLPDRALEMACRKVGVQVRTLS